MTLVAATLLASQVAAIAWVDAKSMRIPDINNLMLAITGVTVNFHFQSISIVENTAKPLCVYLLLLVVAKAYQMLRGRQGLGGGDIKMLAAASAWLSIEYLPWAILAASISGLFWTLLRFLQHRNFAPADRFPFGPHIAIGLLGTWIMTNG